MNKVKLEDCEVTFEALPEFEEIRGNCIASGDDDYDKKVEDGIIERLNSGDIYAWFIAHVKVSFNGLEAGDYLGGCCYESEDDFIKNSGYYDDMLDNCLDDINKQVVEIAEFATA